MKALILFCFTSINLASFGQAFEKNELIVEVGMGFPNLSYFRSTVASGGHFYGIGSQEERIHKSYGQFIASSEYLMTDKIGFEIGFHYGKYYDYRTTTQEIFTQNAVTTQTYFYEQKTNRLRVYLGMNFHVIRTERLDSYFGIKCGIKKTFIDYESNDPNNSSPSEFEIPFGLRATYGIRYFINQNWGLHTEMGLGGPVITFGLTYKLID